MGAQQSGKSAWRADAWREDSSVREMAGRMKAEDTQQETVVRPDFRKPLADSFLMRWRRGLVGRRGLLLDMLPDDEADTAKDEQQSEPEDAVANCRQQLLQAGKGGEQREEERR